MNSEPLFFDEVLDALAGSVPGAFGRMHSSVHRGGLKIWFDESTREHYETQLMRGDDGLTLEIGFHAEHPKVGLNEAAIAPLEEREATWRKTLGDEPVLGEFLGRATWRRISECWNAPPLDDIDAAIEVADRLGDYIRALEPLRRAGR
jgi:hypothetical protein